MPDWEPKRHSPLMSQDKPSENTRVQGELSLLRHTLATLAYRGSKAFADAPSGFAGFVAHPGTRTPLQIVAHLGDLFDWAIGLVAGKHVWQDSEPLGWDDECARLFARMAALDRALMECDPTAVPFEKLFQGPIADALTHVGQISLLRRMAGSPVRGENYFTAAIVAGQLARNQAPPAVEFE